MVNERTFPCLPCADLDEAISFYEAIGFTRTYRQLRPNPYGVVAREDLQIHLFGMRDFDPANSYGSVIVTVPDPDALYRAFAAGLRDVYGKLPVAGIPRMTRPRKKLGTVRGFSVVDVGGNWLRISKSDDSETSQGQTQDAGLAGFVNIAARLGDARGDEEKALRTINNGLRRFPDAPPIEQARAILYRAELEMRMSQIEQAKASLNAVLLLKMSEQDQQSIADELADASRLVMGE